MNTIAPGPFNPKATKRSWIKNEDKPPTLDRDQESFAKPAPAERSRNFDHSAIVDDEDGHVQRPSTAGAEASRKLSLSSISGGPRSLLDRRPPTAPSLPSGAPPPRPARSDGDTGHDRTLPDFKESAVELLRQEHRSQDVPIQSIKVTAGDGPSAPLPRRPSAGAPRRRPTVSAANRPLDEIGSQAPEHVAEKDERQPSLSFSRPMYTRPLEQPPGMEASRSPPESPMDPAIQNGVLSPIPHPSHHPAIPPVPTLPAQACDVGIEGQYLETELKQKFHPGCFTCQDCRKVLRHDYYEMNGRTYCEQHAFRAAQQTSKLGPG
ncbi:MAG: hypothetical protein LQ347_005819, partial [Umbilicaria vellea]